MNGLRKFVESDLYLILISVAGFLIWYFQPELYISAIVVFALASFLIFTQKNSNGLLFLFFIMLVSNVAGQDIRLGDFSTLLENTNYIITLFLIGILLLEMIIFLIVRFKKQNKSTLWIGFVLITISFAISGVKQDGSIYVNNHFTDVILMGIVIFLFLFFAFTFEKDSKRYICKCLLYLSVYIAIQVFVAYIIQIVEYPELLFNARPNMVWGNVNTAASVVLLSFPAGAYLYVEKPNFFYFFLTRIVYVSLLILTSRGGIWFGTLALLLIDIYARIQVKDRRKYNLIYFGSTALVLVALVVSFDYVKPFLDFSFSRLFVGSNLNEFSSGRIDLYKEAIRLFLSSPIIGVGTTLAVIYDASPWYHSTFFDTLAGAGIVGLVMLGFHMFQKYKLLLKNKQDPFVVFVYIGFICSGLYGVFDVTYYHFIWLILFAILLASVEVQVKTRDSKKVETLTPLNK